jgi:hypothetical protein
MLQRISIKFRGLGNILKTYKFLDLAKMNKMIKKYTNNNIKAVTKSTNKEMTKSNDFTAKFYQTF